MALDTGEMVGSALYGAAIGATAGSVAPAPRQRRGRSAGIGAAWGAGVGAASYAVNSMVVRCAGLACTPWVMIGTLAAGAAAAMAVSHDRQQAALWGAVVSIPAVIIFGPMINAVLSGTGLQRPQPASAQAQAVGPGISYAGVWHALPVKPGWA